VTHAVAYLWVALGPAWALKRLGRSLWRRDVAQEKEPWDLHEQEHRNFPPWAIGLVERPLFLAALLTGNAEFVGIWFALKVIGGWKEWTEGKPLYPEVEGSPRIPGRSLVNSFSTNAGLSLLFAAATAQAVLLCLNGVHLLAGAVLFSPFVLWYWIWSKSEDYICRYHLGTLTDDD
jgi:hypothetical protein